MIDLTSGSDCAEEAVLYLELSDAVLEIACGTPVFGLATLLTLTASLALQARIEHVAAACAKAHQ